MSKPSNLGPPGIARRFAIPTDLDSRKWQGGHKVLETPANEADRHGLTVPAKAKNGKIRFDRTAYQRDYMRKRRAKEKK